MRTDFTHEFSDFERLLGIDVDGEYVNRKSDDPDDDIAAHVHMNHELSFFTVDIDPDLPPEERRLSVMHELLHVAFRHVGAVIDSLADSSVASQRVLAKWLERAIEEDTERLADSLYRHHEAAVSLMIADIHRTNVIRVDHTSTSLS